MRSLLCAAVASILALPSTSLAADPVATCAKAIAKSGTTLVQTVLKAEQACLERLARGKVEPGAGCTDEGPATDAITDAKTIAKVEGAIARARATIEGKCAELSVTAAPPSGIGMRAACQVSDATCPIQVDDLPSLLDCLECTHVNAAHGLLTIQYPESTRTAPGASVIHVDGASGSDAGACGPPAQPCKTIQHAVNVAVSGDEIRVAQGTYTYDGSQDACAQYIGTTAIVCILNKQLVILGGFSTSDWTNADPVAHLTRIDGQDNRRGVLVQRTSGGAPAASLTMEGFTIMRGRVQGAASGGDAATFAFGAGMLVDVSPVVLRDLVFSDNQALGGNTSSGYGGAGSGGGLAIRATSATLERLSFDGNRAQGGTGPTRGGFGIGGGLYTYQTTVVAQDLTFVNNVAAGGNSGGSGTSGGERADGQGGGAAFQVGSDASITHVIASDNQTIGGNAGTDAGGAFGGGLYAELATLNIVDANVEGNVAVGGNGANGGIGAGGGLMGGNATVTIDRGRVVDNRSTGGNGTSNRGTAGGGGVYLSRFTGSYSGTITNTVVAGNLTQMGASGTPLGGGGGGLFLQGIPVTLEHVTVAGNRLGAAMMQGAGLVLLSGTGGASATIRWSIIAQHTVPSGPAALHVQPGSSVTLARGIFSGNGKDTNADGSVGAPGSFSGVATMLSFASVGFVAPNAPSFDYHIGPSSPAVNQATGSTMSHDLDGAPRSGTPDIGADEAS